jgi:hypothetical protein
MKTVLVGVTALALLACSDDKAGLGAKSNAHHDASARDAGEPAPDASEDAPKHSDVSVSQPCGIDTGWRGDEQCVRAPEPSEGFQLHFGPNNYDDADEIARYTLEPGKEKMLCTYIISPNDQEIYYDTWLNRLRPGSHHMIVTSVADGDEAEGVPCSAGDSGGQGIIGGNTTTVMPLRDVAPENEGIAHTIAAHTRIGLQLHFFNTTDAPLLMEAWQNIYYKNADTVRAVSSPIESLAGLGMSVKLGTTEVVKGSLVAPSTLRVLDLYSHNHDHTLRFTTYLKRAGETARSLIYESYDWEHPVLLPLDSLHKNAEVERSTKLGGGMTGTLEMHQGDALEFECEIRNDDVQVPLRFANEAHTAEMCILRGDYTPSLGRAWASYSR